MSRPQPGTKYYFLTGLYDRHHQVASTPKIRGANHQLERRMRRRLGDLPGRLRRHLIKEDGRPHRPTRAGLLFSVKNPHPFLRDTKTRDLGR